MQRNECLDIEMGLAIGTAGGIHPAKNGVGAEQLLLAIDGAPCGDDERATDFAAFEPAHDERCFGCGAEKRLVLVGGGWVRNEGGFAWITVDVGERALPVAASR